jgi:hypothetical protein
MQDPNEDTEWNDVLRAKGILPPKEKKDITEDDIVSMLEQTIQQKSAGDFIKHLLNQLEDPVSFFCHGLGNTTGSPIRGRVPAAQGRS